MIGRFATGSSGLGWLAVIGRSRVPSPPAMTTAFTGLRLLSRFPPLGIPRTYGPARCSGTGSAHFGTCAATHQVSHLREVQHRGPPVQNGAPGREGPAYYPGQ